MPKYLLFIGLSAIGVILAAFAVALVPDAGCGSLFAPNPTGGVSADGSSCTGFIDGRASIFWILLVFGIGELVMVFFLGNVMRRRAQTGELA